MRATQAAVIGAALATSACFGASQGPVAPSAGSAAPAKPAVVRPACITAPDEMSPILHAVGDDSSVSYCIGDGTNECFSLDLAGGALKRLAAPPKAPPAADVMVETTSPEVKVCTAAGCKSLAQQLWPGAGQLQAASNGTVAVVLLGDAPNGKGYADVWDVVKSKRITTIRYPHGDWRCGDVAMLGDTIYIGASVCAGPSARAALYTAKGRKIANVGGKDFGSYGSAHALVDGTTWAFLDENAQHVVVQDVATGKVAKTIDVAALFKPEGAADPKQEALGNPGESALLRVGAGKVAVIAGTPSNGSVAVIDVASGEVNIVRAPFCAAS